MYVSAGHPSENMGRLPSIGEVVNQVLDDRPAQTDADIRPSHPRTFCAIQFVLLPFVDVSEVIYARIVVVLAGEYDGIKVSRVGIGNRVAWNG